MRLSRMGFYRKLLFGGLIATICCMTFILLQRSDTLFIIDRKYTLAKIDEAIKKSGNSESCKQPVLPVAAPEMMKFVKYVPPIDCTAAGQDWVVCENYDCQIRESILVQKGPIECSYKDMIRLNDDYNTDGEKTQSDGFYKLEKSDVVEVNCKTADQKEKWRSVLSGIRFDKHIFDRSGWEYVSHDGFKMNVLMFGFDSLSRNTVIRKLPKSYQYLTETLETHILSGYNIVGDGTPQALTPILTGKSELELPETRKRVAAAQHVDVYPMIWKDYQNNGYVTGFLEDCPTIGTYTYRLKGFKDQPTDHYSRPYYISALKYQNKWPEYCAGDTPRHTVMLNNIKQFFSVYHSKPKFIFGFHGELSHDSYNLIGAADDDFLQFMKDLHESGALNNTIFIFMADHGHRFADIRNTVQGKLEERLPFFSFSFPKWFKSKHPTAYKNFMNNRNTLITPYDIHATLKHILQGGNLGEVNEKEKSLSLFSKIPADRSCAAAYIEPHWCACLQWTSVQLSDPIVARITHTFTRALNEYTLAQRNKCAKLAVAEVFWVNMLRPNDNLLKFRKNADVDGFIPDLGGTVLDVDNVFQIKVRTVPGDGLYEASVTHYVKEDRMELKMDLVSRINVYGRQARCIEHTLHNLRKYCYCLVD